jgi:hypothetical protein
MHVLWPRRKTLVTKGGSLGRSGIWKSLTLSRHEAAGPAIFAALFSFSPITPDDQELTESTKGRRAPGRGRRAGGVPERIRS